MGTRETKKCGRFLKMIVLAAAFTVMLSMPSVSEAWADDSVIEFSGTWLQLKSLLGSSESNNITIKLLKDVVDENNDGRLEIQSGKEITLDLNGFVIDRNNNNGSAIYVGGSLILEDSNPQVSHESLTPSMISCSTGAAIVGGAIVGGCGNYGGGVCVDEGSFTMNGGTIAGCTAHTMGGGVYVNMGNFTMNGGLIVDCYSSYFGGGVQVSHGNFSMKNGVIENCSADTMGGGIQVHPASTFLMTGGRVTGCSASMGGGIMTAQNNSVIVEGGTIEECTAYSGGGVYIMADTFIMRGDALIKDCTTFTSGDGCEVYLWRGNFIMEGGNITSQSASLGNEIYVDTGKFVSVLGKYTDSTYHNEIRCNDSGASFHNLLTAGPNTKDLTYSGGRQKLLTEARPDNSTVYYFVSKNGSEPGTVDFGSIETDTVWSTSIPEELAAGEYPVWMAIKGTGVNDGVNVGPVPLKPNPAIKKATPLLSTSPTAVSDLTEDGTHRRLITGGSAGTFGSLTPSVTYALTTVNNRPDNGYSAEIPSATDANTYYVWYRIEGSNNWNAVNSFDPIVVVIKARSTDPGTVTPGPNPDPSGGTVAYNPAPTEEKKEDTSNTSITNRTKRDGSIETVRIVKNEDNTVTSTKETVSPGGEAEIREETTDAEGNGSLSIVRKDSNGKLLSKTEGTISKDSEGTRTVKSTTENIDGSVEEKIQEIYLRDVDGIKKITTDTKKTGAEGDVEHTVTTVLSGVLGEATITEESTYTFAGSDLKVKEEREYLVTVNGRVKLISLSSERETVKIPASAEVDGKKLAVKSIGRNAMKGNKTVRELVLGNNITTICTGAFKNCKNLEVIKLTGSIRAMYKNAFKGIAKNAKFEIEATEEDFARIVELLKGSGVSDTVTFVRIETAAQ